MALLELKNLNVSYGSKKNKIDAVKIVSLKINEGDIFGGGKRMWKKYYWKNHC